MHPIAIIPARYQSTRLPAKMLADIGGKPLIQWVYERSRQAIERVVIATDHADIYAAARSFGADVYMTDAAHLSGTDRCAEVLQLLQQKGESYDLVLNIQGDEPFIEPAQIKELIAVFERNNTVQIGTLAKKITESAAVFNPNMVKVVFSNSQRALYFSRHPLPYMRGLEQGEWLQKGSFYRHIGLYGFRASVLPQLTALPPSALEKAESLEQLRWLENDYAIYVGLTEYDSLGIDTQEDLEKARKLIAGC